MCDGRIAGSSFRIDIAANRSVCRCRTRGCSLHWPHSAQAFGVARWSDCRVIYLVLCSCFAKCFVTVSFILTLAGTLHTHCVWWWRYVACCALLFVTSIAARGPANDIKMWTRTTSCNCRCCLFCIQIRVCVCVCLSICEGAGEAMNNNGNYFRSKE